MDLANGSKSRGFHVPIRVLADGVADAYAHGDTAMNTDTDMDISTITAKGKPARKAKSKPPIEPKGKRSLNLSIPQEDYQRLAVHALDEGKTISDLVCELARTHLRRVHITRTATRTGEPSDA
jgi:hypothetical protein